MDDDIRILVVDDHAVFAEALSVRLAAEPDVTVVDTAQTPDAALAKVDDLEVDTVILDIDLRGSDGLALVREIRTYRPDASVVVLTGSDDVETAAAAIRAGAEAFVPKASSGEVLVEAVRAVQRGENWIPPDMLRGVLAELRSGPKPPSAEEAALARLSAREREVLALMAAGCDRTTIAKRLYLSPNTVRTHVQNMLSKLGVQSSVEAVALALRAGWRPDPSSGPTA